ncbi:MAG: hypothetical protein WA474_02395 [Candidatus Sulfotelmatobacter sp.]
MRLSAVNLARTLAFIELTDLDPKGKVYLPEFVRATAERYKFERLPKREEQEKEGLIFEEGKIGTKVIRKLTLYDALIVLETRSNTSDSKQLIEEFLVWGAAKFGLNYAPGAIKRFAYVSDVTFYSDVPILSAACQPLLDLANKTTNALTDIWQESVPCFPANLAVGPDPMSRKYGIASFLITHRAEARFSENKYFSEAPLPTDVHIAFLEEYEAGIQRLHGAIRG